MATQPIENAAMGGQVYGVSVCAKPYPEYIRIVAQAARTESTGHVIFV